VTKVEAQGRPPEPLLEAIGNLARFHREHEKFYSQAPLRQAGEVQAVSRALKSLAGRWSEVEPSEHPAANPFAGAEDLNAPGLVAESGILFMEGEAEPAEIKRIKRDLETLAADSEETGAWLSQAMEQAWEIAGALASYPALADLLGERHRIIANDWQSAGMLALVARLLRRALDLLGRVEFSPEALRADLAGARRSPAYLYSASELLDRGGICWPSRRRSYTTTSAAGASSASASARCGPGRDNQDVTGDGQAVVRRVDHLNIVVPHPRALFDWLTQRLELPIERPWRASQPSRAARQCLGLATSRLRMRRGDGRRPRRMQGSSRWHSSRNRSSARFPNSPVERSHIRSRSRLP
jgi:hypothetical protein